METNSKCPTIEAFFNNAHLKYLHHPPKPSESPQENQVRLKEFEHFQSDLLSLSDPNSDIEFEWDEKVEKEYK